MLQGFARPSSFGRWMLNLLMARRKLDKPDFAVSALWGAFEAARCGITSFGDTAYDGLAVARAAAAAGLRARVYQEVFGLDDSTLPRTMERYEEVMTRLRDEIATAPRDAAGVPLVEAGVSPHAPYTVSARLYREAARFARRAGLRLATHVAESSAEVQVLARGSGPIAKAYRVAQLWTGASWTPPRMRPVEYVAAAGALSPDTLVIHAVEVDAAEIAVARRERRGRGSLPALQRPPALRRGAGGRTAAGRGHRGVGHRQPGLQRLPGHVRGDAGGLGRRAGPRSGQLGGRDPALSRRRSHPSRCSAWPHWKGRGPSGGGLSRAVSRPARAPTLSPCGFRPRRLDPAAVSGPAPAASPVEALVAGGSAADVRLTMVAGSVVFSAGIPPSADLSGYRAARGKLGLKG